MKNYYSLLIFFSAFLTACGSENQEPWRALFNGESLDGWIQINGEAPYTVENEEIVGRTVAGSPNSFLCTEEQFSDFILEFEVKKDTILNSGVQIRSNSFPQYNNGRVHGYQVEIDNQPNRRYSGGIYDEARRGWLANPEGNSAAQDAYKFGQWNKYRIEAIGPDIKVWINDTPVTYLIDDLTPSGFIGLQVHSIPNDWGDRRLEVRWRNIRIITDSVKQYAREMDLEPVRTANQLTQSEKDSGWRLLFNGSTTNGWKGAYLDQFPEKGWKVENGELIVEASGGEESQHGGDIVTTDQYEEFELQLDFKLTEGANSGIKYYVTLLEEDNQGSAFGPEFQILDDENHPDAKMGREGNRTVGSLYDLIPAQNKLVFPVGQWNHARIVSKGNTVEHWLNYVKVVTYERGSDEFRELVEQSKYAAPEYNKHGRFGEAEAGHILLQDHGDKVHFKNIKIKTPEKPISQ